MNETTPETFDAFKAGWEALQEWHSHEWGPEPPSSPTAAYAQWIKTCSEGHIIRVVKCKGLLPMGGLCEGTPR